MMSSLSKMQCVGSTSTAATVKMTGGVPFVPGDNSDSDSEYSDNEYFVEESKSSENIVNNKVSNTAVSNIMEDNDMCSESDVEFSAKKKSSEASIGSDDEKICEKNKTQPSTDFNAEDSDDSETKNNAAHANQASSTQRKDMPPRENPFNKDLHVDDDHFSDNENYFRPGRGSFGSPSKSCM